MQIIHQGVPEGEEIGLTNTAIHQIQQTQMMKIAEREKLDNFSMCLKKDAAEYYSVLREWNEMNFLEIKKRFEGFFDKTEPAFAIRWDILNIEQREDEPLEKYLARLQGMIMRAYPGSSPSEQDNTLFIEVFLKGCREKGAVLAICDKKPTSLEEAYKFVQSASQYRRAVLGKKVKTRRCISSKLLTSRVTSTVMSWILLRRKNLWCAVFRINRDHQQPNHSRSTHLLKQKCGS